MLDDVVMGTPHRDRLPPGRQPYDPLNGLRVGALVGAFLGTAATAVSSVTSVWLVLVGAAIGGVIGYAVERQQSHQGVIVAGEGGPRE